MTLAERFWRKVDRRDPSVCWPWTGTSQPYGYGRFQIGSRTDGTRRNVGAHRLAWELTFGPIPAGEGYHGTCALHECDNPPCCNPWHLFLGTQADNNKDKALKGRSHEPRPKRKVA